MAKADIIEVIGRKNGHTCAILVSVEESVSKLKIIVNIIAPELLRELGPQYLANYKIIAKSVEVPDSWVPHKILNKK